jgi:PAS domain S-box-containing protein
MDKTRKTPTTKSLLRALEMQRTDARCQAEQWLNATSELEATLDRYISLFTEAPIGYATLDDKGVVVQMNTEAAALLGIGPRRATAKAFIAYVHREDARLFLGHVSKCARTGESTCELRLKARRTVRLVSRRTQRPTHAALLYTIISDVDAERQQQQALHKSEARYREIVETAGEGICIVNDRNEVVFANRRLGAMLGVPAESLIGRSGTELVGANEAQAQAQAQEMFDRCDVGRDGQMDQQLRRADGLALPTAVSTTILRDDEGRFTGMLRMYTDLTARHELTQSREALVRKLVAAQESERQRIARELHDQLGQHIVGLALGLARLYALAENDEQLELIALLRRLADLMGKDVHTLALELRPAALDHLGLSAAVRAYAETIAERSGLDIDVHAEPWDDTAVKDTVQTGLYRIAQEESS